MCRKLLANIEHLTSSHLNFNLGLMPATVNFEENYNLYYRNLKMLTTVGNINPTTKN